MAELDEDLRKLNELDSSFDENNRGPPDPAPVKIAGSGATHYAAPVSIAHGSTTAANNFLFANQSRSLVKTGQNEGRKRDLS